jgi:prepilin-type processing-associated H-X9-DG protein
MPTYAPSNPTRTASTLAAYTEAAKQPVKQALLSRGVSMQGTQQLLAGQVVTNPGDRQHLARIIDTLVAEQTPSAVALLLPAVQSAREAVRATCGRQKLHQLGLSAVGGHELFAGLPVTRADDRQALGFATMAALGGRSSTHTGAANFATCDGAVRF